MSTEQTVCGIPDLLILMEEIVKIAEDPLVFKVQMYQVSLLLVQETGETPWDLQMQMEHLCDAFSPLPSLQKIIRSGFS